MDAKNPKSVSEPITTEKPRELTDAELNAVHGGGKHAVSEKEFKGSTNAYNPGAWADSSPPPKFDS
jgi:hypothetical protein